MRRWFLSYHSPDSAVAERLKAAVERQDDGSVVFFAPTNLRAGRRWAPALADAIADATAFILLVTESGIGRWQEIEYEAAFDKHVNSPNFPVILLLLEGQPAPRLSFLKHLHWIVTPDPGSEKNVARLIEAAAAGHDAKHSERWRYSSPYRGLTSMQERDADYFFGRERETIEVLNVLAAFQGQLPVLLGNSGVGKSSIAQAGVIAALRRQAWPEAAASMGSWPAIFRDSRRWCVLSLKPGHEPLNSLVEPFLQVWQYEATEPIWEERQKGWIDRLSDGRASLTGLLDATERRFEQLGTLTPPAFFLYIDQGEELYIRGELNQRRRFSQIMNEGLKDSRLRALMSMRADFLGELHKDEPIYQIHRKIDVPPLREEELRRVIKEPARQLSARFESEAVVDVITTKTLEDSVKDVGALPLLSYTLDDMWAEMVHRGDGLLRLPTTAFELGGVLAARANGFLAHNPAAEDTLHRIFTLKLATIREDGEPTRRRAQRSEFTNEEWRLVNELANDPNRLLVTVVPEGSEPYAEVAHEAVFRRWEKLRGWITSEREFLAWRSGFDAARRGWQTIGESSKSDALLMGIALAQAQTWLAKRPEDLHPIDRDFIAQSIERERRTRRRARRITALVYLLVIGVVALIGWINRESIEQQFVQFVRANLYIYTQVRPFTLSTAAERALRPGDRFRECANDCPEMVVVPAGNFLMGSPANEKGRIDNEGPQHMVAISRSFAVSRYEVTYADWDACVTFGGCESKEYKADEAKLPVVSVRWDEARRYAAWLSSMTGQRYRLLSEAEWEYAARAGSTQAYSWGEDIGRANANCLDCGSAWDGRDAAPVGSFAANVFGLYDMHGNVWEWVEDCYRDYGAGPTTFTFPRLLADCDRVVRGGSWRVDARYLRAANRDISRSPMNDIGFRLARTLAIP